VVQKGDRSAQPSDKARAPAAARIVFIVATALAAIQIVRAWLLGLPDHAVTVSIAWTVALSLAWRAAVERHTQAAFADRVARALGALGVLGALAAALFAHAYQMTDRVWPSIAGAALALAAWGPRGLARHRRELLVLALPLVNPMPCALRTALAPTHWTAWSAMILHRVAGHEATVAGNVLSMPGATLEVMPYCGGIMSMSELWVLGAVVMALFPMTVWQRLSLLASATLLGFLVNAVRIAVLAGAIPRGDAAYEYWHQGAGSELFSLGATALAGALWWWMLRAPSRQAALAHPKPAAGCGA
jgi:exosortase/archaeosortase family protein